MSSEKNFTIEKVENFPDSGAIVSGEISLDFLKLCRKEAIKHLNENLSLPGFRKGFIPEETLVKSVGEMHILEETAEIALAKEYANIVVETKLKPIMRPEISVTKLAPGIPLSFKMTLVLEPEFTLPDYKKIAEETKEEDQEKRRVKILEKIVGETKVDFPQKFIEAEIAHTLSHFKADVEKAGLKWDEYLEKAKKTEEEIKTSWKEHIISRNKAEFVIGKMALKEGLKTYEEVFKFLETK